MKKNKQTFLKNKKLGTTSSRFKIRSILFHVNPAFQLHYLGVHITTADIAAKYLNHQWWLISKSLRVI